jgi:hypothetical protein
MKIEIDREPRSSKEGTSFNVRVIDQGPDFHWQFKIDVWSDKGTGVYRLRLDGFNYLRNITSDALSPLMHALSIIDSRTVLAEAKTVEAGFRQLIPERKEIPDATIIKFFEVARDIVLNEFVPLLISRNN